MPAKAVVTGAAPGTGLEVETDPVVIAPPQAARPALWTGLALAMAGSIAFSGKAIIVKLAYRYGVDAVTLIMYRMLFALPLFVVLAWWAGRGRPALTKRDWLVVSGLGFSGYYLASFLDFAGLVYVTASLERLILYLNPTLVLAIGLVVFKRKASLRQVVALAVSYCGVLLVFGHEVSLRGTHTALGSGLVFASAVSYAIYLVASGEEVKRLGALRLTGLATSVACLFCIAQFFVLRPPVVVRGRARGHLALGAERHRVHVRAGVDGDDGDRAGRRDGGRADGHDRAALDDRDGHRHPGRAVHRLDRRRHGAGVGGHLAAREMEMSMDLGISGKWALVCAASKGLGKGCATALAKEGVNVVITARGGDVLEATARELRALGGGGEVRTVAGDITTIAGRAAALAACPQVDILVNNAGGPPPGDFRDWDREAWLKALDANMLTPIELIKATVDRMAERGFGRVVNITSGSVKAPIDVLGLSNGARSGLTGFVAGVARTSKLASRNVTVNGLLPGWFDTDRVRTMVATTAKRDNVSAESLLEARKRGVPAQRLGHIEEFGATCAFLCSVHAGYITGQNLLMDGGAYPGTF